MQTFAVLSSYGAEMGIRDTLNENPKLAGWSTAVVIAVSVIFAAYYAAPTGRRAAGPQEYYSDDDGKTWFAGSGSLVAPFNHNGKQAVLAKVYQAADGSRLVGYLERFSDDAKSRIEASRANGHNRAGLESAELNAPSLDLLVKKPQAGNWVSVREPGALNIETCHATDGSTNLQLITPDTVAP